MKQLLKNFQFLIILLLVICHIIKIETLTTNDLFRPYADSIVQQLDIGDENYLFIQLYDGLPIHFYDAEYDHFYVNTNGLISFGRECTPFNNRPFPFDCTAIAPFYSNIDTSNSNGTSIISYFKDKNVNSINRATELIKYGFSDSYDFVPIELHIIEWENVGYYNGKNDKQNRFQLVIVCGQEESYALFLYPMDGLNWIQAEIGDSGLPDVRAQAGFIADDGRYFKLKESGTNNVRYLNEFSNRGISGVYLYRIGPYAHFDNIEEPDQLTSSSTSDHYGRMDKIEQTCAQYGRRKCHMAAGCYDNDQNLGGGFTCKCKTDYYGNGCNCLKSDQPIRVSGHVTGQLNSFDIATQLQAYVMMTDGRTYTAISSVPPETGFLLQYLPVLGSAIGWIFGKPTEGTKNGYQITGGIFNLTSRIQFDGYDRSVIITQRFVGLNAWDQLAVDIQINGYLPFGNDGNENNITMITIPDILEEYHYDGQNTVYSNQRHYISVSQSNLYYNVSHEITFNKCNENDENLSPFIQYNRVTKISNVYQSNENALRIGMVNKFVLDRESNACIDGSAICGENTICVAMEEDEGYSCECKNGYAPSTPIDGVDNCVDINECNSFNICDENAECTNELGGYTCRCRPGYIGGGDKCELISTIINATPTTSSYDTNPTYGTPPPYNPYHTYDTPSTDDSYPTYSTQSTYEYCTEECSSNGYCLHGVCVCNAGWQGDGIDCQLQPISDDTEEAEIQPFCHQQGCSCPTGYDLIEYAYTQICRIQETVNNENTQENHSDKYNEESPKLQCDIENNCDSNANCEWIESEFSYKCVCNAKYEGDGYICTEIELSCIYDNICDIHASCAYDEMIGKSVCKCDKGYIGDGKYCHVAPECQLHEDCGANSNCADGVCVCDQDFERDISDFCVPSGSCGGAICAENSKCEWDHIERISYCHCPEGFVGDGLQSCKSLPPPCNIRNNCGLNAICMPNYRNISIYECVCNTGYYGDGFICIPEITCYNTPEMCDPNAKCVSTSSGLQCVCNIGFIGNGSHCMEPPKHDSGFLLVSQGIATVRIPFNGSRGEPLSISSMAIGLDKDCSEGRVYWGDILAKTIYSSKYDGSDFKIFLSEDIMSPEGIAIDWISRKIYWTDSTKDTIEVASIDNSTLRTIVIRKNLVNPRGIAVDPVQNKLYWSDWDRNAPKIEWSNLDGTDRELLLGAPRINLPNSLAISPQTGELCFADAGTKKIECIDTYSRIARTVATNLTYPFGFAVTDDHYYWTDWKTNKIESINNAGTRQTGIASSLFGNHKMYGLTAITDKCPLFFSPCLHNNGDCPSDRLCLISNKSPTGRTCKCINSVTSSCMDNEY